MRRSLFLLWVALLFTSLPLHAQSWVRDTRIEVHPGRSAGAIVLGQPVSAQAQALYGPAASFTEPSPGPDGQDTGSLVFGSSDGFELRQGILVKLNDGRGDQNVNSIFLRGVRAATPQGVTMGVSLAKARRLCPGGQVGVDEMSGATTLQIPGLLMLFYDDRLAEMVVQKP